MNHPDRKDTTMTTVALGFEDFESTITEKPIVLVDFWASWCGPCKQSFPFMNELQSRFGADGFEVVAVNLDAKRGDADQFLAEVPARFTLAFDAKGESARRFEVRSMPSSLLIGRDGRIVVAHKGFKADDRKELEERVAQLVAAR